MSLARSRFRWRRSSHLGTWRGNQRHQIYDELWQTGVGVCGRSRGATMTPAPVKPMVSIADLEKLDIRVGTIRDVADVRGSEKLVQLVVSFGDHQRTILAGLKRERADPRVLIGTQALFVVNLAPRKMAGVVSEGMLFDIGYADGVTPVLAQPESPVPDGSRAG